MSQYQIYEVLMSKRNYNSLIPGQTHLNGLKYFFTVTVTRVAPMGRNLLILMIL